MNLKDHYKNRNIRSAVLSSSRDVVRYLSSELGERTLEKYDNLCSAKEFIKDFFTRYGQIPLEETYSVSNMDVTNVLAEITGLEKPGEIILLGAHYDTVENTPGADDNASGIAGLLEVYRLLSGSRLNRTIRFAAFTLEEPPYFSTDEMGSMVHAAGCAKRGENVKMMICLEMIGYGSSKIKQEYPANFNSAGYPGKGDFLLAVTLPSISQHAFLFKKAYNRRARNRIIELIGPSSVPGVGLSDHTSFIKYGFPAVMLTDTGFYRNNNYHRMEDTIDTLNFSFLADNIINIYNTLLVLGNMESL